MAQRAEGVAESLRSSETQLLSVCFHRKAVSDEWNISLNTILSTLNTFTTPPSRWDTSPINSASSVNRGGHRDIEPLAQVMGSVLLSINNLSPTARLWQGVSLCLRSSAEQIGGVARSAEGVDKITAEQ